MREENGVYLTYAFEENETELGKKNNEYLEFLKSQYIIEIIMPEYLEEVNQNDFDIVLTDKPQYGRNLYTIIKNSPQLPMAVLALIAGGGLICFGYYKENNNQFSINNGS